jgi:hypothetical protein
MWAAAHRPAPRRHRRQPPHQEPRPASPSPRRRRPSRSRWRARTTTTTMMCSAARLRACPPRRASQRPVPRSALHPMAAAATTTSSTMATSRARPQWWRSDEATSDSSEREAPRATIAHAATTAGAGSQSCACTIVIVNVLIGAVRLLPQFTRTRHDMHIQGKHNSHTNRRTHTALHAAAAYTSAQPSALFSRTSASMFGE